MTEEQGWADEALSSASQDLYGTAHVAKTAAKLIVATRSREASSVLGLVGPWGSGKSSLIAMCCEELRQSNPEWKIARFTPWATTDVTSMLADFYRTLAGALPQEKSKELRKSLARVAVAGSPALKLLPTVGAAAAGLVSATGMKLLEEKSWDVAFADASARLRELNTPVLIVVDDVDRLYGDELTHLLKVIRLLGRFPGVSYLLAYDEETLFSNLERQHIGPESSEKARLFMEKIVQYPLTVPMALREQVLEQLNMGLSQTLSDLGRGIDVHEGRLSSLADVYVSQLRTPRAISRFLAQVRLTLSMHEAGEINESDVILLTFLRVQFPRLYAQLPRWKAELTGSKSRRRRMQDVGDSDRPVDFGPLLEAVSVGDHRDDARDVLERLFPATRKYSSSSDGFQLVRDREYFDRYFVNTVPRSDIADADLRDALVQAGTPNGGCELISALMTGGSSQRSDLAIRRMWTSWKEAHDHLDPLVLLTNLMSLWEAAPTGTGAFFDPQQRLSFWAAEILAGLADDVPAGQVLEALNSCEVETGPLNALWETQGYGNRSEPVRIAATDLAEKGISKAIDHLRQGDSAPIDFPARFIFLFAVEFAGVAKIQALVQEAIQEVGLETFGSRLVTTSRLLGVSEPKDRLSDFDQSTFSKFAPEKDPLYSEMLVSDLDSSDVSWENRRSFAVGRMRAPNMTQQDSL